MLALHGNWRLGRRSSQHMHQSVIGQELIVHDDPVVCESCARALQYVTYFAAYSSGLRSFWYLEIIVLRNDMFVGALAMPSDAGQCFCQITVLEL